ncbi:MAG: cyclic nucleotide-binding domain-containing protein [Blastocatellia bacterium]|nr:cyclic nucleotide-binding domain-containing protein [Blastocatellia bacterium]
MPQELEQRRAVLEAIQSVAAIKDITAQHDGHFEHEIDLEVIVYGRNYNGKKVGPYVRLLVYSDGEEVMREGEWGGNTFYVVVEGKADIYVMSDGQEARVAQLSAGDILGEMSILAGVPRSATVRAPAGGTVKMLEVQRPALRLLRKLPNFGEALDHSYRHHGRSQIVQVLSTVGQLSPDIIRQLEAISQFRVFGKGHVLFHPGEPIKRIYVVKSGWLRLSPQQQTSVLVAPSGDGKVAWGDRPKWETPSPDSYFGPAHAFGLEGVAAEAKWQYTGVLLGRTELLEVSIAELRNHPELINVVGNSLRTLGIKAGTVKQATPAPVAASQRELIATGVVDGTNLLLMDMELCVRCGNCSLACQHQHGNSRLLRRGISITRPTKIKKNAPIQFLLNPSVCMHCKDPECMTGCPTGAISRYTGGYVDITKETCIGCGDCATQCPYDAISLIARRGKPPAAESMISKWLSIAPPPAPPSVEEVDDLVAVKCNLCSNTPLNPKGAKSRAYSCEENCPTGALLRVDPAAYFEEIGNIQGVVFRDETHRLEAHLTYRPEEAAASRAGHPVDGGARPAEHRLAVEVRPRSADRQHLAELLLGDGNRGSRRDRARDALSGAPADFPTAGNASALLDAHARLRGRHRGHPAADARRRARWRRPHDDAHDHLRPRHTDRTLGHRHVLRRAKNHDADRGAAAAHRRPAASPQRVDERDCRHDRHGVGCDPVGDREEGSAAHPVVRISDATGRAPRAPSRSHRVDARGVRPAGRHAARGRTWSLPRRRREGRHDAASGCADIPAPVTQDVAGASRPDHVADVGAHGRSHHPGDLLCREVTQHNADVQVHHHPA